MIKNILLLGTVILGVACGGEEATTATGKTGATKTGATGAPPARYPTTGGQQGGATATATGAPPAGATATATGAPPAGATATCYRNWQQMIWQTPLDDPTSTSPNLGKQNGPGNSFARGLFCGSAVLFRNRMMSVEQDFQIVRSHKL